MGAATRHCCAVSQSVAPQRTGAAQAAYSRHGGVLLVELLAEHGVTHVFGVPGGQTLAMYDALAARAPAMHHVLVRDERTGAYAADGYARVTGRVGVCDATVGPGAAKLPSGLGESLGASVPVLAIVSDLPQSNAPHRDRGAASQALDQLALLAPVTKWRASVPDAVSMPALVRRAFREATGGRPGPVALVIPQDVLDGPAPPYVPGDGARFGRWPSVRSAPDASDVAAAAAVLAAARRPFVLAGGGALHAGASAALLTLAERLQAAVATTMSGKGAMAEDHPLALGTVGTMGTTAARAAFEEADVVLLVGTKASGGATFGWTLPRPDQRVVQLDVDPGELGRAFPTVAGLAGDARLGLEALVRALDDVGTADARPGASGNGDGPHGDAAPADEQRRAWCTRIRELSTTWRTERDEERSSDAVPIAPARVLGELEATLGPEDVVICDASLASGWGTVYLEQGSPGRRILAPRGFAGLGYALPAAIGVATAMPDRRVVVLTGDGALGYALGEMPTISEHGLAVTVVVLNNQSLGWIRWYRRITFGHDWEQPDFSDVPFAAVATAFGWTAARVTEPNALRHELARALASPGPSLVDIVTETWHTPIAGHRRALFGETPAPTSYGG